MPRIRLFALLVPGSASCDGGRISAPTFWEITYSRTTAPGSTSFNGGQL